MIEKVGFLLWFKVNPVDRVDLVRVDRRLRNDRSVIGHPHNHSSWFDGQAAELFDDLRRGNPRVRLDHWMHPMECGPSRPC